MNKTYTEKEMQNIKGETYFKAMMNALKELKLHTEPSPETVKFMAVVDEKLDSIGKSTKKTEKHLETLNSKVATNSRWRYTLIGGMTVIAFLFPLLTGIFVYFLKDIKHDMADMITIEIEKNNNKYFE